MSDTDSNLGADGLTPAGRQALEDKAAAAAKVTGNGTAPTAADAIAAEGAAMAADAIAAGGASTRRKQAAAARAARGTGQAAAKVAEKVEGAAAKMAPAEAQAAPAAPEQAQPCEPCLQHWQAVAERMERLEVQVQAIGKLVVAGVVGGAVIYFLARRPQQAAPAAEIAQPGEIHYIEAAPAPVLAEAGAE
jgi:hypothetical protein